MPCNDPEVYCDRHINKMAGRGYGDSKDGKQLNENLKISEAFNRIESQRMYFQRKVGYLESWLCGIIKNFEGTEYIRIMLQDEQDVSDWWKAHKELDAKRSQNEKK